MSAPSVHQRIGARVRAAREAAGLSQGALAALSGVARTSVTNIEAGRQGMDLERGAIVARALGIAVTDLIAPDDLPPMPDPPAPPHKVTVRRTWEAVCETCDGVVIDRRADRSAVAESRREHIAANLAA